MPLQSSVDAAELERHLLRIVDYMKENHLSLRVVIIGLLSSENHAIATRRGIFYKQGGLMAIMDAMVSHCRYAPGKRITRNSVKEMASDLGIPLTKLLEPMIQSELLDYSEQPLAKLPPKKMTSELAEAFEFKNYYETFSKTCPILTSILTGCCSHGGGTAALGTAALGTRRVGRDVTVLISSIMAMLAYGRLRTCNSYQVMMGYFLQSQRVSKRAVATLNQIGICCSYTAVQKAMRGIAQSNLIAIRVKVANGLPFGKAWDNCQMASKTKAEQTMFNQQAFTQYTASLMWFLHLPAPKDNAYMEGYKQLMDGCAGGAIGLSYDSLYQRPEYELDRVNAFDLFDLRGMADYFPARAYQAIEFVLQKHFKEALKGGRGVLHSRVVTPSRFVYTSAYMVPVNTCQINALPALELDETSTAGTAEIVREHNRMLGIDADSGAMLGRAELDIGDHLTLMRLASLIKQRKRDFPEHRLQHMFRINGLLHVEMAIADMILRAHWGRKDGLDPASLSHFVAILGRNKIGEKKAEFNATRAVEQCVWEGIVLAVIAKDLGVETYNDMESKLREVDYSENIARVVDTYMPLRKVSHMRKEALRKAEESWEDIKRIPLKEREGIQRSKDKYVSHCELEERDVGYENLCLFLQHGCVQWMFHEDIKVGDTAGLLRDMELLTLMLNGCKKFNYGTAMLELLLDRKTWWTAGMEFLWLNNAVINLSGRERKFMGVDQANELLVKMLKVTHNPRGTPQSKDFHLNVVAMNAFTFSRIGKKVVRSSGAPEYGSKHGKVDDRVDSRTVMETVMRKGLMRRSNGRSSGSEAQPVNISPAMDLLSLGKYSILYGGKLNAMVRARKLRLSEESLVDVHEDEMLEEVEEGGLWEENGNMEYDLGEEDDDHAGGGEAAGYAPDEGGEGDEFLDDWGQDEGDRLGHEYLRGGLDGDEGWDGEIERESDDEDGLVVEDVESSGEQDSGGEEL